LGQAKYVQAYFRHPYLNQTNLIYSSNVRKFGLFDKFFKNIDEKEQKPKVDEKEEDVEENEFEDVES
jgi:hypothetical protein